MRKRAGHVFLTILLIISSAIHSKDVKLSLRRNSVSRQNLITGAKFKWEGRSLLKYPPVSATSQNDTLRVLALRAEFQVDQNDSTTGDGTFLLGPPAEPTIDPPPHDLDYFQGQLKALSNYYRTVSRGKLILQGDVSGMVLTLPFAMGHYNPATTDDATDEGLARLFRDAVLTGDDEGILFSDYDCFIVFHAGVGRDINLGYDPTIQDIPSAFLSLPDLQKYLAPDDPDYPGISVENGQIHIQEGMILPETQSQEGYEIGLLGTITLMFGFQLGLPALWNTETGQSGIGTWGLMDQGSGNFFGLIPAEPCAFSKVFLGWEEAIEIRSGVDMTVSCRQSENPNKIFKLPINDHEYFLIENRMHDFNGDHVARGWDETGETVVFDSTGLTAPQGVIVGVDEYDFGLPGSGILIWHIDEEIIERYLPENKINGNPDHRGVDLEEADGAQDIGENYGFLSSGSGSETGVMQDAWYKDNEIHMLANNSQYVAFTPSTYPNTDSNTDGISDISITDFSAIDSVMRFSVHRGRMHDGFPADIGMSMTPYQPEFGDLNGDGSLDIVVATEEGFIFVWDQNGDPLVQSAFEGYRVSITGDTTYFTVPLFGNAKESITCAPVIGDLDLDGVDEVIAGTISNNLMVFDLEAEPNPRTRNPTLNRSIIRKASIPMGEGISALLFIPPTAVVYGTFDGSVGMMAEKPLNLIWQTQSTDKRITGICQLPTGELAFSTLENGLFLFNLSGDYLWEFNQGLNSPVSGYLSLTNPFLATFSNQGDGIVLNQNGMLLYNLKRGSKSATLSNPALGDIDGDGFHEIVTTAGGQIWAYNHNGSAADYFPIPHFERDLILSSPILGDVDGNGIMDVLAATSDGRLEAWQSDGKEVEGFPLSTGSEHPIPPALVDLDQDGKTELVALSSKGYLLVWDLDGEYDESSVPWGQHFHDSYHTGMNPQIPEPDQPHANWMPKNLVYNYPNPTEGDYTTIRYRLEVPASVTIRIFDLAGILVDEMTGPGAGQTENEVIWHLKNIDPGVYFCEVKARSDSGERTAICKIAVVK